MLKLRRLEISGFKSFVDNVSLDVAGGLTAIVGPNGCGKSNIADAVVWVLGERSAKSLRGERMEDVIFAGAKNRKPLGMAEVFLDLETDNGFAGTDDGRLKIGRRVFRSGESQYLLNGKSVRLKDIRDLLMDTGLGIRAYSMIEQGKIGMILSGKPMERRRLLEEAAGITRYRERRRLAEIKLEEARGNLARLDDIVGEIERSLRSLKRQAGAARRFESRQTEYRDLLRRVLEARWTRVRGGLVEHARSLAERVARESELTADLHRQEAGLVEGREELDRLAKVLGERHQRAAELAALIEGRQEFVKGSRQRQVELTERISAGRGAAREREGRIRELAEAQKELDGRRAGLLSEHERAASEVTADEERIAQVDRLVSESQERLETLRSRLLTSIGDLTALRNRMHREQVEAEKAELQRRHLADELETRKRQEAETSTELQTATELLEGLETRAGSLADEVSQRRQKLAELETERDRESAEAAELRERKTALERRREILVRLGERQAERREALQRSLATAGLTEPRFLADLLRVPEGWAASLDLFLGELEDAVVVPEGADPMELTEALRRGTGTGRLLHSTGDVAATPPPSDEAVVSGLAESLGLPAEVAAALPPAFLVETSADAHRLAQRHPGIAFVSRDRVWAQAGAIHVQGEDANPGQLAREQELNAVQAKLPPLAEALRVSEERVESLGHEARVLTDRLAQMDGKLGDLHRELAVARARHEDAGTRHHRLGVERESLETELTEIDRELELVAERRERLAGELTESEASHGALEADFDGAQQSVEEAREERATSRTSGASRKGRLELLQERLDAHDQEAARLRREIADAQRQMDLWNTESASLAARQKEIAEAMQSAEDELQAALEQRAETQEEVISQQERLDARREGLQALEGSISELRDSRDGVRAETAEIRVTEAGLKQDAEHLTTEFREEFDEELPGEPAGEVTEAELTELETDLERTKGVMERIGPVNLLAASEYEEHHERHGFLVEQRADVTESVARLKNTIREINETSGERFRETFEAVNEHFRKIFVDLFRGGEAEMRLMDEEDVLDCGIEIVARPPGKRLQNLMLLSGGEKALTAIALLFALFRTKPSPFCVLDEVDAPLDDVNTLRFVELLKRMSSDTQFVVITHNKLTMEAASVLYGVTMQEQGVSNLVSVELDDVQPEPREAVAGAA